LFFSASLLFPSGRPAQPVTPNASPEAVELLQYLYNI
jgi:hypothetical protein